MRQSEFWGLVEGEFGAAHGRLLVREQVLLELGGRTADEALAAGEPVRDVWLALARAMDVPPARWWGRDEHPTRRP